MIKSSHSRRLFLKRSTQGAVAAPLLLSLSGFTNMLKEEKGLTDSSDAGSSPLVFNVRDFGALGDGKASDTASIQQSIDRCHVMGGGEIFFPEGNYFTGAIQLRSNVVLHLSDKTILTGSPDFADYPVMQVRWEGKWIQGHTALIYAIDAENIGIIGKGKIAGNYALGGRPSKENPLRHPALIEPIQCKNVRLEGFSTDYYLMWSIHPTYCENITIRDLFIRSTGGNGDGIDIDSCRHVRIEDCDIATGDDCISLKSGRGMEGYSLLQTTEDVYIARCKFSDSIFACIGIGSETSGGIRNVKIEKCDFVDTKTHAIYIKSRPGRGAFIENIDVIDITVSGMQGGFLRLNLLGSGIQDPIPVPGLDGIPSVKNFSFSNVKVTNVPVLVDGTSVHPQKPLEGFVLKNVTGTCERGITLANIRGAVLQNIAVTGYTGNLLGVNNVTGLGLEDAVAIPSPKLPDEIPESTEKFRLDSVPHGFS